MATTKASAPADAPEAARTSTRQMRVEFHDGRDPQTVVPDSPSVVFKLSRLGIQDDLQEGFVAIWLAAGAPGLNGTALTAKSALDLTDRWLEEHVSAVEDVTADPPTNRRPRRK